VASQSISDSTGLNPVRLGDWVSLGTCTSKPCFEAKENQTAHDLPNTQADPFFMGSFCLRTSGMPLISIGNLFCVAAHRNKYCFTERTKRGRGKGTLALQFCEVYHLARPGVCRRPFSFDCWSDWTKPIRQYPSSLSDLVPEILLMGAA